jgi:hypothetical protein
MAIAIPNEPLETILDVAARYDAHYLVLDSARPRTTDGLYRGEVTDPGLRLRYTVEGEEGVLQVYEITGRQQALATDSERAWKMPDRMLRLPALPLQRQ